MMRVHDDDFEISFFEKLIEKNPKYVQALTLLAEAYTARKLYEKGLEMDRRLAALCPSDAIVFYNLACSYALVQCQDKALTSLERAVRLGYADWDHMEKDPDLKCLRGSPRFKTLFKHKKPLAGQAKTKS